MTSRNKVLIVLGAVATIIGGAAAFMTWHESRAARKLQTEVLTLDKQIKELELLKRSRTEALI